MTLLVEDPIPTRYTLLSRLEDRGDQDSWKDFFRHPHLSIVHVQYAPVTARIAHFKHTPGQYLNAMKTESAQFNENILVGFDAAEPRGEKIGVRLIAGLIARRIVPWIRENDAAQRGKRVSLIQFGSRVDIYLPRRAEIKVKLGDRVVGGETVIAAFD